MSVTILRLWDLDKRLCIRGFVSCALLNCKLFRRWDGCSLYAVKTRWIGGCETAWGCYVSSRVGMIGRKMICNYFFRPRQGWKTNIILVLVSVLVIAHFGFGFGYWSFWFWLSAYFGFGFSYCSFWFWLSARFGFGFGFDYSKILVLFTGFGFIFPSLIYTSLIRWASSC